MPTIKLSGGKVVLKGGKVSCSCCEPGDCCLYPWLDPSGIYGGPFYPDTDLPSTVILDGITMTRSGYQYFGSGFPPAPSGSTDRVIDSTSLEYWNIYDGLGNELQIIGNCLIVDLGTVVVEDEFLDVYTAEYGEFDPLEVPRVTLCLWQELGTTPPPGEVPYVLEVGYGIYPGEPYKWGAIMRITEELPDYGVKDDPQSSPEGEYVFDSSVVMTVSV